VAHFLPAKAHIPWRFLGSVILSCARTRPDTCNKLCNILQCSCRIYGRVWGMRQWRTYVNIAIMSSPHTPLPRLPIHLLICIHDVITCGVKARVRRQVRIKQSHLYSFTVVHMRSYRYRLLRPGCGRRLMPEEQKVDEPGSMQTFVEHTNIVVARTTSR
jgi:hypothetical protein